MSGPQLNNCDREVERFYGSRDWKAGARPQLQGAEDFTPFCNTHDKGVGGITTSGRMLLPTG